MKITFDHNCLIHLENGSPVADCIHAVLNNPAHECFVVNVGASEMQRFGVRPDNYAAFEELLDRIKIADRSRLDPLGIWGITFWDHCVWAGDADEQLFKSIQTILFPSAGPGGEIEMDEKKSLNRLCDALTMWCHISYKNDVFLTTDGNFFKETKMPALIEMGAGSILRPCDL